MTRKQHTPEEKAKLALEAIRGDRTINEIASENNLHPNMLSKWKKEAETQLYILFQDNTAKERKLHKEHEAEINVGSSTLANALLDRLLHNSSIISITGPSYRLREKKAFLETQSEE